MYIEMYFDIVKALYTDNLYNSRTLHNDDGSCTNVTVQLEFEFVTKEIQLNINLLGDKHCCSKECTDYQF